MLVYDKEAEQDKIDKNLAIPWQWPLLVDMSIVLPDQLSR